MSDMLADLRRIVEQFQRLPPPLVIQVHDFMPDDMIWDRTGTEQAMEWDRWMDGEWVRRGEFPPKRPKEWRVCVNRSTLAKLQSKYPEMFAGPFGVPVIYPDKEK